MKSCEVAVNWSDLGITNLHWLNVAQLYTLTSTVEFFLDILLKTECAFRAVSIDSPVTCRKTLSLGSFTLSCYRASSLQTQKAKNLGRNGRKPMLFQMCSSLLAPFFASQYAEIIWKGYGLWGFLCCPEAGLDQVSRQVESTGHMASMQLLGHVFPGTQVAFFRGFLYQGFLLL